MTDSSVTLVRVAASTSGIRRAAGRSAVAALTLMIASACYDQVLVPGDESNERLAITNDEALLDSRVAYLDQAVAIGTPAPSQSGPAMAAPQLAPSSISLKLIAEVEPPTVSGETVQATSVSATSDGKAIVSYNFSGTARRGGADYFTNLNTKQPKLRSSVVFADSDVSAVSADGFFVYAAEATDDTAFPAPAALERIGLSGNQFVLLDNQRVPLSSFAATSTLRVGSTIYATSGDGGGVFALSALDLGTLGAFPLDDARWVAFDEDDDRIVVVQGTPGRLSVFAEGDFPGGSMSLLDTFTFPGADIAESKSTVDVAGGKAFVAAGPAGVQVVCLDDGQIVGSVPRPDPASLGLDPSVVVTNAVAVEGDLMFISNGEAGVYVAVGAARFEDTPCAAQQQITVLGQLQFDDLQSVNHVELRDDLLFIAAGLGGLKVVEVDAS